VGGGGSLLGSYSPVGTFAILQLGILHAFARITYHQRVAGQSLRDFRNKPPLLGLRASILRPGPLCILRLMSALVSSDATANALSQEG
jgi:hypothetical protein